MTQKELINLAEPFGALSSVILEKPPALVPPSARIEYAECFEAARAVSDLDNKVFQSTKLAARLDLRAVESGIGLLLSRKVKISWFAPTAIAWAHYGTIASAKKQAELHYLVGPPGSDGDPFVGERLGQLVPHLTHHDVYVCGPPGFMTVASERLLAAGVPRRYIHREYFAF